MVTDSEGGPSGPPSKWETKTFWFSGGPLDGMEHSIICREPPTEFTLHLIARGGDGGPWIMATVFTPEMMAGPKIATYVPDPRSENGYTLKR